MHDEPIQRKTSKYGSDEDTVYQHPSHGLVSIRRNSGAGIELFGSELPQNSSITITIDTAETTQRLGSNWYHSTKSIAEVELTPVQYAEMLSNPNSSGVPCTVRYSQKLGTIKYKPIPTELDYSVEQLNEVTDTLSKNIKPLQDKATELLTKRGTLKASEKAELLNLIKNINREMRDGVPFYTDMVKKNAERMVTAARVDVENVITNVQNRLGSKLLELLEHPELMKTLLEYKNEE